MLNIFAFQKSKCSTIHSYWPKVQMHTVQWNDSRLMKFPLCGTHGKTVIRVYNFFMCPRIREISLIRCHSAVIPLYVFAVYLEQKYFLQIDLKDLKLNKEGSEGRKTLVVRNLIRHS